MIPEKVKEKYKFYESRLRRAHRIADFCFNKLRFFGSRKLARVITAAILPKAENENVISPTIFGFDLVLNPTLNNDLYFLGFYEMGTLNVMKGMLHSGDTFLDIGANVGLMSLYASHYVGKDGLVIAFEPTRQYYGDLTGSMEWNNSSNIKAEKLALGSEPGQAPIYFDRACPSLIQMIENDENFEMVQIARLDDYLLKEDCGKVACVKIDVEGFELDVLKGATGLLSSPDAPHVCIEYIPTSTNPKFHGEEVIEYLLNLNDYKLFQLEKTSSTVSWLVEINTIQGLRGNDNVYCILKNKVPQLQHLIKNI